MIATETSILGTKYEHRNYVSGHLYVGPNNIVQLTEALEKNNYKQNLWLTFLQAKELGLKIKKGSKGVRISKGFGEVNETIEKDGKEINKSVSVPLGGAVVFNIEQTERSK